VSAVVTCERERRSAETWLVRVNGKLRGRAYFMKPNKLFKGDIYVACVELRRFLGADREVSAPDLRQFSRLVKDMA